MKVVVVEGDAGIRELVRWSLALDGGFLLEECAGPADALATVARAHPDLVLVDAAGVELARRMRASRDTAGIPVALLTAPDAEGAAAAADEIGAVDVIATPFDPRALPSRLRAALAAEPGRRPPAAAAHGVSTERLQQDFRAELAGRVRAIEEALRGLPLLPPEVAQQAALLAHRLAETTAVLGLHALSDAARTLEDALGRSLIEHADKDRRRISTLVGELRRRVDDQGRPGTGSIPTV
jgi:DNA-binding response OmpR family regulator